MCILIEYIILYGIILHVYHYIRRSFLTDPKGGTNEVKEDDVGYEDETSKLRDYVPKYECKNATKNQTYAFFFSNQI